MKRREGVDIKRERGRITKRNEDRGREREGGKVGRKDGGGEEEDDWAEKDEGQTTVTVERRRCWRKGTKVLEKNRSSEQMGDKRR